MESKDLDVFRVILNQMLEDILRKGEETIEDMTDTREVYADPADRATAESDRSFTLRLRDRERKLIKKIQEANRPHRERRLRRVRGVRRGHRHRPAQGPSRDHPVHRLQIP